MPDGGHNTTGNVNQVSGIYVSACHPKRRTILEGQKFPRCASCDRDAEWIFVNSTEVRKGERIRLMIPTFGLTSQDGQTRPVPIAKDSVIEIVSGTEDRQRMVEIDVNGVKAMMFVQDIQERGFLIERSRAKGSRA